MPNKKIYKIVPSFGMYGSGQKVRVYYVTEDKEKALKKASKWTLELRREMARYGGTSGGYRVIEDDNYDRVFEFGHDLDQYKTVIC